MKKTWNLHFSLLWLLALFCLPFLGCGSGGADAEGGPHGVSVISVGAGPNLPDAYSVLSWVRESGIRVYRLADELVREGYRLVNSDREPLLSSPEASGVYYTNDSDSPMLVDSSNELVSYQEELGGLRDSGGLYKFSISFDIPGGVGTPVALQVTPRFHDPSFVQNLVVMVNLDTYFNKADLDTESGSFIIPDFPAGVDPNRIEESIDIFYFGPYSRSQTPILVNFSFAVVSYGVHP